MSYMFVGMSFSGREFDNMSEEQQREACRSARSGDSHVTTHVNYMLLHV